MIKLIFKDKSKKLFNLTSFDGEKKLEAAWYSMHNDDKFNDKKFNITTDTGEKISVKLLDISECKFDDSTYIKAEVRTKREEPKKIKSFNDSVKETLERDEKRKVELLFSELKKRNIPIDLRDPMLIKTIRAVKRTYQDSKIPFLANLYCNMR